VTLVESEIGYRVRLVLLSFLLTPSPFSPSIDIDLHRSFLHFLPPVVATHILLVHFFDLREEFLGNIPLCEYELPGYEEPDAYVNARGLSLIPAPSKSFNPIVPFIV